MNSDTTSHLITVALGIISLIIGLTWKKPASLSVGIVHKYGAIALGIICIIIGLSNIL